MEGVEVYGGGSGAVLITGKLHSYHKNCIVFLVPEGLLEASMKRSTRRTHRSVRIAEAVRFTYREELNRQAYEARQRGRHHSGYKVGAAGVVQCEYGHCVCSGANYKPNSHQWPRICAEELLVRRARKAGGVVLGFVVVAAPKVDDASNLDLGFAIPCVYCRRMFREELRKPNGVLKPHTWLWLVNAETGEEREFRLDDFLRLVKDDQILDVVA